MTYGHGEPRPDLACELSDILGRDAEDEAAFGERARRA